MDFLIWGFGFSGAMGFNGSLAIAMLSWAAQDVLEEIRSDWMHLICWSWAIWPPLLLVTLVERCTLASVSSVKELREVILNTWKLTSIELEIIFPLFFVSTRTCCHGRQIFRLVSRTLFWIVHSHQHRRSGVMVWKNSAQPTWYCMLHAEATCFNSNLQTN